MDPLLVSILAVFGVYLVRRSRRAKPPVGEVKLVAHRGGMKFGGENSRAAVEKSLAEGAKLIEVDVRRTKTGVFIIRHDGRIKDKRDGKVKKVADLSYGELSEIYTQSREELMRLDEVLELIQDKPAKLVLDIKQGWMEKELIAYLKNRRVLAKIHRFDSCFVGVLATIKRWYPQARTGISFPKGRGNKWILLMSSPLLVPVMIVFKHVYPWLVRWVAGIGQADVVVINFRLVSGRLIRVCHEAGLGVSVFAPSMKRHIRKMIKLGVDEITTDDMRTARRVLVELQEQQLGR